MVLNFGGSQLFDTSLEERWKGIYADRIEGIPNAASNSDGSTTVGAAWETVVTVTIEVKPDEKVVVIGSATGNPDLLDTNIVEMRLTRGGVQIGRDVYTQIEVGGNSDLNAGMATIHMIDNPGEGAHVYNLQGQSDDAHGKLFDSQLTAFVIAVK